MAESATTERMFSEVPAKPDHVALEHAMLAAWEDRDVFERLRRRNEGREKFRFVDGPITANNPMGVHHAWGRTLKDLYQRYWALKGFDEWYQNGFDCQGLWVEVEVEKSLGLNSKREIEEYGLDRFSRACRDRVAEYSQIQRDQSIRLGQWMRWDKSYYTLSDTNISYIWKFLARCHERGWLYQGHRPMVWCPRCGTSLSQHELIDAYSEVTHPSLWVRFPLVDRDDESIVVWTTTPWTLPANVAAAVAPEATYAKVKLADGQGFGWVAEALVEQAGLDPVDIVATVSGADLAGLRYEGPFDHLPAQAGIEHRVLAWDEVSLDEGTGIVHIAPGCGAEDYELGQREGLESIMPVDDAGIFVDGFAELTGVATADAHPVVIGDLKARTLLVRSAQITHRYPSCWRCGTELIFRLVDEWFISCDEIREQMLAANRGVEWVPEHYGKRMEDWLNNMGDWCISRKRYWGLPLPFYFDPDDPDAGIFVVESREQLADLAVEGLDQLEELHKPWIDNVRIKHPETGRILERVPEIGDCWLDAGIVPFATLGWQNPEFVEAGYATGASVGLSTADLPSHEEWEQWFPTDLVIEMREQIRLWFYSMLFMSVVLEGRAPYKRVLAYEKVHDETGRPMHKSWGNAIWFDDAVEEMGADIMRWQYTQQSPAQNLNFGYGPAGDIKRRFLTLWNVYGFLVTYARLDGWAPDDQLLAAGELGEAGIGLAALDPDLATNRLDRWLAARTHSFVAEATAALDRWDHPAYTRHVERYVEELSNWYVRRSRRRFWKAEAGSDDQAAAYTSLWGALVTITRVIAPAMPFLADHMWQNLVADLAGNARGADLDSVHLSGWPVANPEWSSDAVVTDVAAVQRVLGLGRAARNEAGHKLRQPLRQVVVHRRPDRGESAAELANRFAPYLEDIRAELSVKDVRFADEPEGRWTEGLMPLLPVLGPKYGQDVGKIRQAVQSGDVTILDDGRARVGEFTLEVDEYEHRSAGADGWAVAGDAEWVAAVDTEIDDELRSEGLARDIVRALQKLRKDSGFEISDRISLRWQAHGAAADAMRDHADTIADEILAVSFEEGSVEDGTALELGAEELSVAIARHTP